MTFWQRLFFPKTTALIDREVEIAHQREINAKLVDAICRGRGEQPAFTPDPPSKPEPLVRYGPEAEEDDWRDAALLAENDRLVRDAVDDGEAYESLWLMAEEGRPGAKALLDDADERIAAKEARTQAAEDSLVQ